jgi:hypothetical protein
MLGSWKYKTNVDIKMKQLDVEEVYFLYRVLLDKHNDGIEEQKYVRIVIQHFLFDLRKHKYEKYIDNWWRCPCKIG